MNGDEVVAPAWDTPGATASETITTDILIVGSGMGGGTLAYALRESGLKILIAERGERLPREPENSSAVEVYVRHRYQNADTWYDGKTGAAFKPGVYYYVGGNTKVYGACLPRFRESDFEETQTADGVSPAWPFTYKDLEPFYSAAEHLYQVRGEIGDDSTEPPHSQPFPYPALQHEPAIAELAESLKSQGLHPFRMATGMQLDSQHDRELCTMCDGAPCEAGHKSDAENRAIDPALVFRDVSLETGLRIDRLVTDESGKRAIAALAVRKDGRLVRIEATTIVLAAGAVNSSVVLLRSVSEQHRYGLANSSGLVGRNYMVHDSTFVVAVDPRRRNNTQWQKTLGLNDWYESDPTGEFPLGNVQMLGKLAGPMLRMGARFAPIWLLDMVSKRTVDLYLTTEDLPRKRNGVTLRDGRIEIFWTPTNMRAHDALVRRMRRVLQKAGYPFVLTKRMGIETNSHQCGTAVAGNDPSSSVLDVTCRSHDVENLFIADGSFFPSSAALNPALTIAANALRIAPTVASSTKSFLRADPATADRWSEK
ncbi:MAG: glucose-methanol-choline oxidoreductase [Mycetocola sp.]|jgi:choline dehydrogenase-like flavoprotein|nr:glucose-methanol-choline oxidoreductase [Mycetocola sp.]